MNRGEPGFENKLPEANKSFDKYKAIPWLAQYVRLKAGDRKPGKTGATVALLKHPNRRRCG